MPVPALLLIQSVPAAMRAAVVLPLPLGVPDAMTRIPWEASWMRNGADSIESAEQPPSPQRRTGSLVSAGTDLGAKIVWPVRVASWVYA